MTRRRCWLRLTAAVIGIGAGVGISGVAVAQPDPSPPAPSIIDQLVTSSPILSVNPTDDGSESSRWGDYGMICQNFGIRCR